MTADSPGTDRDLLTQHAYADDEKLNVRYRTHKLYTIPQIDFLGWVLDRIHWRGDECVLDVGAGPGAYFQAVKARVPRGQHFAGDLSFGMIRRQRQRQEAAGSHLANLDVQRLPYPDHMFDVVLANHMLYHVPDLEAALGELRRVLKPEGVLLAATNSAHNMPEFNTLYRRALLLLTNFEYQAEPLRTEAHRFALENGSMLMGRHFYAVARHDLPSALVFTEADPVIAYLESTRDLGEHSLPDGVTWEVFIDVIRQQITRLIDHTGRLVVNKLSGALVATDAGGFAAEYVRGLESD
ncbi:MAG: class I SAM-dependent methyltransferase [Anaerolineae bacterium]|nr:class I SAM-dependent methyltransferase [Anaerolineae bacterium]